MDKNEKAIHYVDNEWLYEEMSKFHAKRQIDPKYRIPESIGRAILKIAENVPKHPFFSKYKPIREAMTSQAVENCIRYINNWDPADERKNPFGYFSQIAFFACKKVIGEEKFEFYLKHEAARRKGAADFMEEAMRLGTDDPDSLEDAFSNFSNRAPQREMTFGVPEQWPEEKVKKINKKRKHEKTIDQEIEESSATSIGLEEQEEGLFE